MWRSRFKHKNVITMAHLPLFNPPRIVPHIVASGKAHVPWASLLLTVYERGDTVRGVSVEKVM